MHLRVLGVTALLFVLPMGLAHAQTAKQRASFDRLMAKFDKEELAVVKRLGTAKAKRLFYAIIAADRASIRDKSTLAMTKGLYDARRAPLLRRFHVSKNEAEDVRIYGDEHDWPRPPRKD